MPEVLGLCDRLIIMRNGRIATILDRAKFDMETVFAHAAGIETASSTV
jgi:ABC-type sugar transport system ATPase subunit